MKRLFAALTLSASNGVGSDAQLMVTIKIQQAPMITSANSASFLTQQAGTFKVTSSGFPAPPCS